MVLLVLRRIETDTYLKYVSLSSDSLSKNIPEFVRLGRYIEYRSE